MRRPCALLRQTKRTRLKSKPQLRGGHVAEAGSGILGREPGPERSNGAALVRVGERSVQPPPAVTMSQGAVEGQAGAVLVGVDRVDAAGRRGQAQVHVGAVLAVDDLGGVDRTRVGRGRERPGVVLLGLVTCRVNRATPATPGSPMPGGEVQPGPASPRATYAAIDADRDGPRWSSSAPNLAAARAVRTPPAHAP